MEGSLTMRTVAWASVILGTSLMLCAESSALDQFQNYHRTTPPGFKTRQYRQSPEGVKRLTGVEITDAETYFKRGLAYEKLGENEKAVKCYTRALQIRPGMETALNNRGVVYY